MRAWTVEADDIRVAEDLDEALLHRTPDRRLPEPGPRRQVHPHRHQGVREGRPWLGARLAEPDATPRMLCVLAADVQDFGGLMRAGADAPVRRALKEAVRLSAKDAVCAETRAGDAVLVIHDDPVALARSARLLVDEVYAAPDQPRLRVALHHGEVLVQRREGDHTTTVAGGEAVLCAVRVEPHVEPGQIWVTKEFRDQLALQPSLWRTSPVAGGDFNARKGDEPDLWVRLYRLEF